MIKIFVYVADQQLAEQTVQRLKEAGAKSVALLESLKVPARQPKENRYLFICETPAEKLFELAPKVLLESEYAEELGKWYQDQNQILEVAQAQKSRSLIGTKSQLNDNKLFEAISDQWCLNFQFKHLDKIKSPNQEPLLSYLVNNLINVTPALKDLAETINDISGGQEANSSVSEALVGYRNQQHTIESLQRENQTLVKSSEELQTDLDDLNAELQDVLEHLFASQKELERIFLEGKQSREEASEEINALRDKINAQDDLLDSANSEANLCINSLHQTQEELERYFINYKKSEIQISKLEARWEDVLTLYPDHLFCDSINVTPIDQKNEVFHWTAIGIEARNVSRSKLEFDTFIENKVLGVRFNRPKENDLSSLKCWPSFVGESSSIDCIPAGKDQLRITRANLLRELSTSDWHLLKRVPALIRFALNRKKLSEVSNPAFTEALDKFSQGINALPAAFRYDAVKLKQHKVNPDYEYLWLVFENASFGEANWPQFECRLGAASVEPNGFSKHPKLEFPLIGGLHKPFESWFEESKDEFGKKFELRFDIDQGIYDLTVWNSTNIFDRSIILNVLSKLPGLLRTFEDAFVPTNRPWSDWINLYSACHKLMRQRF